MKKYADAVEKNRKLILDSLDYIWENPETGWKEFKTSKYMEDAFESLGYEIVRADGVTGFYTVIDTGIDGPEILVLGELDSVVCFEHPDSDKRTGAVHACGHCAQCAALLGIAAALKEPGALDGLCGRIRLCAVPAEELLEIEYRKNLIKEGKISYMGGKVEFLKRGYFDTSDIAIMVHTTSSDTSRIGRNRCVGCMPKKVTYKGVAAHAGSSPQDGVNALYAATLGLHAINSVRETFKNQDYIRVHPIITKGGDIVNTIPDVVMLESYIRGLDFAAIKEANDRVNRALIGSALALGANIEIEDSPGYAPCVYDAELAEVALEASKEIMPDVPCFISDTIGTGSSDIGDISMVMPSIQPDMMGASGHGHGADYKISDPELAVLGSAKWQLGMLKLLLENNGSRAKKIIENFVPTFSSKKEYFDFVDTFSSSGLRIDYSEPGRAIVKL